MSCGCVSIKGVVLDGLVGHRLDTVKRQMLADKAMAERVPLRA